MLWRYLKAVLSLSSARACGQDWGYHGAMARYGSTLPGINYCQGCKTPWWSPLKFLKWLEDPGWICMIWICWMLNSLLIDMCTRPAQWTDSDFRKIFGMDREACGCVSTGFASVGPNQALEHFLHHSLHSQTIGTPRDPLNLMDLLLKCSRKCSCTGMAK